MRIRVKSNPTLHTSTFDIPSLYLPVQNCLLSTKPFPPYYSIQSIIPPRVEERLPHRLLLLAARMRWLVRESSCIWNVRREVSNTSRWLDYRPRYFRGCAMRRRGELCIWIPLRAFHRYGWSVSLVTANDSFPAIPTSENCLEGSLVEGRGGNNIETKSRINLRCLVARHSDYLG